jgi:hypothetical protein
MDGRGSNGGWLMLTVWTDSNPEVGPRVRLMGSIGEGTPRVIGYAQSVSDVCIRVRSWLEILDLPWSS